MLRALRPRILLRSPVSSTSKVHLRSLTSGTNPVPQNAIYVSQSTDPYFNLTLEDWLFRHKPPSEPLLLLYRDAPCVVIGRNQNPWKEVNLRASRRTDIPFLRRHSGGGTVYHDLGNTNFSIHLPRTSFDRHATAQVVLRAVRSLGVDARVNERNDLCVGPDKVSGSAYKIVKDRAYHHGTMLISTQLDTLGELLRANKDTMETRGVASVRSPVRNLQQSYPGVDHAKFVDAVVNAFREEYGVDEEVQYIDDRATQDVEYIRGGIAELKTWDWAYGQTPEFTYRIRQPFEWGDVNAELRSKHGVILQSSLTCPATVDSSIQARLDTLLEALEGQRYEFADVDIAAVSGGDSRVEAVWAWLKETM